MSNTPEEIIEQQKQEIERLTKALQDVAFSSRTKENMKKAARRALGLENKYD